MITKLLGGAAAVFFATTFLFVYLYQGEVNEHAKFRAAVESAQEQAEEDAKHQRAERERILADYGQRWAAALAARPVVRVRDSGGCLSQTPGLSATAPGTAGLQAGSGTGGTLDITLDQCERVANWSIEDAIWIDTVKRLTNDLHEASK